MAEQSMLWTTSGTGDGVGTGYASNRWQAMIKKLFLSDQAASACVLAGVDNELAVSGTASPLSVASGAAIGHSFFYENDAPKNLTVTTPAVNTTGGHIIIESNWAAQTVRALAVRNTDGVAAIPALTQTAGTTWQVRLATFTITTGGVITLTDARKRAKYSGHIYSGNFDSSAVDNVGIEISSGALRLKDSGVVNAKLATDAVSTIKIANDAVDDTKVGNRVMQFYRRQGGSASDWSIVGNTNQTPTTTRAQAGVKAITFSAGVGATAAVTFPAAYSNKPLVLLSSMDDNGAFRISLAAVLPTTTGFTISGIADSALTETIEVAWLAIGPE